MSVIAPTDVYVDLRSEIQTRLSDAIGIKFVAGVIQGPVMNRELGCVFFNRVDEDGENVLVQTMRLTARAFQKWINQTDPNLELPYDPSKLERWTELMQVTLAPGVDLGPWQVRVTSVLADYDVQGVEASILAYSYNLFGC